jgi:hypothetical protein
MRRALCLALPLLIFLAARDNPLMVETDTRILLHDCGGFGGIEAWIAGRRWKTTPAGWLVTGELQG